jgi:hypothetical protein
MAAPVKDATLDAIVLHRAGRVAAGVPHPAGSARAGLNSKRSGGMGKKSR